MQVDAVKRQAFKRLPHTLCFQLKRFEFDYETMQRLKVKDAFDFPMRLDMRPFTLQGLAEAERQVQPVQQHPDEYYIYDLVGVVVHSGSAFAGHYYSYIRERTEGAGAQPPVAGAWYSFDDKEARASASRLIPSFAPCPLCGALAPVASAFRS